ncbi:Multiple RNA-binding domain-containing protein 1 [Cyberlindnera fabianii]|uniref:Multiple RNA-binding domain-containing protein 1 n=1 Tax=Cyberlindnera fabianii TaxID=36022 RepID=A0A1V2L862_CYBFA|nr:Multiple RNA-binding domain-containing protein 1 [Cyberlindnera fabianii]
MSRIIVKNIPKYVTEDRLKQHFAKKGDVTDVKLRTNNKGESRRFAFIGYRRDEDAEAAVKFFDQSFMDTSKLDVQLAKSFADPTVPKSFKQKKREAFQRVKEREEKERAREEQERERKRQKRENKLNHKSRIDEEIEQNPALKEFIEATKPSTQTKSWSNDIVVNEGGAPSNSLLDQALALKTGSGENVEDKFHNSLADEIFKIQENESDDEYADFGKKDQNDGEEEEPMLTLGEIEKADEEPKSDDGQENSSNINDEGISDLEWLKKRRIRIKDNEDPGATTEATATTTTTSSDQAPEEATKTTSTKPSSPPPQPDAEEVAIDKIRTTGRLFLRNILYTATEDDFRALFAKFGQLEEVHVAVDTRTGASKGFCYIKFANPDEAVDAYIELDKQIFQGRLLHILPAEAKKDHKLDEFDLKNLPLKKQRELKKKYDASKQQFSWNSLYLSTDAVMDTIAADLGVSKSQLIDPENSSSAVKQALAEAHVIGDVRKFFESKGIDLTKFKEKERDDSVILVKNIPYGTTETELLELFTPFGELKRFIMPASGTIAIVQFRDIPTGRSAFTKLAYKRFKKSILYLEKGPKDLFTRDPTADETTATDAKSTEAAQANIVEIADNEKDVVMEDAEVFEGATVSIFVKNLNFSTTAKSLTEVFNKSDGFVVATIKTKVDPRDSTKKQSMGYGFAEFRTKDQATTAIKVLDGTVLDGHKLSLKLSHRQNTVGPTSSAKSKKAVSAKIIVKNLPFEATRKDVFELFNSFGQLKSVRVPKKFDKSARGFAFVEFMLPKEAESAMDQLQGVHLLGRRLVMQYAEQASGDVEEEIEKMTKKVKKQVATQQLDAVRLAGQGKRKLQELDDDAGDEK